MGLWNSVKNVGRAVKDTAMLPVDAICDCGTGGGDVYKGGQSYVERRVKKIAREVKESYRETFED